MENLKVFNVISTFTKIWFNSDERLKKEKKLDVDNYLSTR